MPHPLHRLGLGGVGTPFPTPTKSAPAPAPIASTRSPSSELAKMFASGHGSTASAFIELVLRNIPMAGYAQHVSTVIALASAAGATSWAWICINPHCMTNVSISKESRVYAQVLRWLAAQGKTKHATSLALQASAHTRSNDELELLPAIGKFDFSWEGKTLTLNRSVESLLISYSYWTLRKPTTEVVRLFVHKVIATEIAKDGVTLLYEAVNEMHYGWFCDAPAAKPFRPLSSLALDAHIKDPLVERVRRFLTPEEEKFHAKKALNYRLGLLFFGPPGIGKTSFVLALAGHFRLDVQILSLGDPSLTDANVKQLFSEVKKHDIILFEDIDCAGLGRPTNTDDQAADETQGKGKGKDSARQAQAPRITLAGLLNNIDGATTASGQILIMSANDPDSLCPSLIRPSRIDLKVLFGYASLEVAKNLFTAMYTLSDEELEEGQTNSHADVDLASLSADFAAAVPTSIITPAEVQAFLVTHRMEPKKAVSLAGPHFAEIADTKTNGRNVAAFANEMHKKQPMPAQSMPPLRSVNDMRQMLARLGRVNIDSSPASNSPHSPPSPGSTYNADSSDTIGLSSTDGGAGSESNVAEATNDIDDAARLLRLFTDMPAADLGRHFR